jgi:hypothetical protein
MRMPAYFAASVGLAIAHAPQPVVGFVEAPEPLHEQAARAITEHAADDFAARWPSRAPQAFSYNGSTYFVLPCAEPGSDDSAHARIRSALELDRRLRVRILGAPADPGR